MKKFLEQSIEVIKLILLIAIFYLPYHFFGGYALLKLLLFMILVKLIQSNYGWVRALIVGGIVLVIYFYFGMPVVYGVSLLAGILFMIGAIGSVVELFNLKPGDGSLLTALVLGIPLMTGLGIGLIWIGLDGLNYMQSIMSFFGT